jgi:hypothetical protein
MAAASDLDLLAHHEAGHAAIAHLHYGLRLRGVGINHLNRNGGASLIEGEKPCPYQLVIILLAGSRAELVLDEDSLERSTLAAEDERQIDTILRGCNRAAKCRGEAADS